MSHWTDDLGNRGYTHLTNFTDDILWTSGFNTTFDSRDSDTIYTNGTGISLTDTTFSIVLSYFQGLFIELTDSFGGEVSGTYDNLILNNDALDDQYIELIDLPLANLTTPYCGNITGAVSNLCTLTDTDTTYSDLSNFTNNLGFYNSTDFVITDYYLDSNPDDSLIGLLLPMELWL